MWPFKKQKSVIAPQESDDRETLRGLAMRLSLATNELSSRVIAFIAARSGEGTSSLVLKYAKLLCQESGKKILLIDAGLALTPAYAQLGLRGNTGLVEAALNDTSLETATHEIMPRLSVARWVGDLHNRAIADRVLQNPDVWKRLQSEFDYILIDAPSLQSSFDGVLLSVKADTTVMVVESESTPTPVTQKLRDTLLDAGAKIAGLVLTKRRYYIPQGVYNKM